MGAVARRMIVVVVSVRVGLGRVIYLWIEGSWVEIGGKRR